uniref:THAP-type domain-containing protein n=2 Tax=Caenorhabditis tropicalis TaxID=1561998 RepID=A0A1I7T3I5_9PELO
MNSNHIETPQCFISKNDHKGKTKPGYLFILCHCTKKFYSGCINTPSMAEAVYQWRKDPDSLAVNSKESHSNFMDKVDCILQGFDGFRETRDVKWKQRKAEEFHWKIDCANRTIKKSGFDKLYMDAIPKNATIAIDMHCDSNNPNELNSRIYCSDDLCYEKSVDVFESSLIALKAYTLIRKSADKGKLVHPTGRCKWNDKQNTKCLLMGFRQLVDDLLLKSIKNGSSSMSFDEISESRISIKSIQNLDYASSNSHIVSWFLMSLYFIPFIFILFIVLCSNGDLLVLIPYTNKMSSGNMERDELREFVNPTLKDIESVLLADMRKTASNVSTKKTSKAKSEMIDIAIVTTTSQMGNMTDLGSEGPTGPNGPSGVGSIKVARELKSVEDTKDATVDGGLRTMMEQGAIKYDHDYTVNSEEIENVEPMGENLGQPPHKRSKVRRRHCHLCTNTLDQSDMKEVKRDNDKLVLVTEQMISSRKTAVEIRELLVSRKNIIVCRSHFEEAYRGICRNLAIKNIDDINLAPPSLLEGVVLAVNLIYENVTNEIFIVYFQQFFANNRRIIEQEATIDREKLDQILARFMNPDYKEQEKLTLQQNHLKNFLLKPCLHRAINLIRMTTFLTNC